MNTDNAIFEMKRQRLQKIVDGDIVSTLWLYVVPLPSRKLAVIEEVYTKPEHRKKGYSTELIKNALKLAADMDVDCVELTVRQDKPEIQEFYKSFGFEDRKQVAMRLKLKEMKPWTG